jgi:N-acetyl-anhydromuramyl-L-alanine amidase AmpD
MFPVVCTELLPQVLFAVTVTVPTPVPMVTVTDVVVLGVGIDHPVPVTAQVYVVAPLTAEILNAFPVLPAHLLAGWVIAPGVAGVTVGVVFPVVCAVLLPQVLFAVTVTVPTPVPMVTVTDVVVLGVGIDHPVPVTAQVYVVAPLTAEILNVFPVLPEHKLDGWVIVPGVAGAVVDVMFPVVCAELLPQVLFAVTVTVPTPVPMVTVTEAVVLGVGIDHPVPVTAQVYVVAPLTAEILNVFPVLPAHKLAGWVIVPGVAGVAVGVMFPVVCAELLPQVLFAVTVTVPTPVPMVTVTEAVVLGVGIDHPVPVTAQVYVVAPLTAEILNVFPVLPAHLLAGWVIAPGVTGVAVGVMFPVVCAELLPQVLFAVTVTVPNPVPMVIFAEAVVLGVGIDHPVPVTAQVYVVAPLTAEILNVFPELPAHKFTGWVIVPGAAGEAVGVMFPVVCAELLPQVLFAVTVTVPTPVPIVTVTDAVVLRVGIDHPVPVTAQV